MEVLIVLATTIAYIYSFIVVIVDIILKVASPMTFFDVAPSKFKYLIYLDLFLISSSAFYVCFFGTMA